MTSEDVEANVNQESDEDSEYIPKMCKIILRHRSLSETFTLNCRGLILRVFLGGKCKATPL